MRLEKALAELRYENASSKARQSELISAILVFALLNHDSELATECDAELQRLGPCDSDIDFVQLNVGSGNKISGSRSGSRVQINVGQGNRIAGRDYIER